MIIVITFERTITRFSLAHIAAETEKERETNPSLPETNPDVFGENIFKKLPPIGEKTAWKDLFKNLIADGHKIVIVSFHHRSHDIFYYLREVLGIYFDISRGIIVKAWTPTDLTRADKNLHIACASVQLGNEKSTSRERILFIDADEISLREAKKEGYLTIKSKDNGSHIYAISDCARMYKKPATQAFINPIAIEKGKRKEKLPITTFSSPLGNYIPSNVHETVLPNPSSSAINTSSTDGPTAMEVEVAAVIEELASPSFEELFPSFCVRGAYASDYCLPLPKSRTHNSYASTFHQTSSDFSPEISSSSEGGVSVEYHNELGMRH